MSVDMPSSDPTSSQNIPPSPPSADTSGPDKSGRQPKRKKPRGKGQGESRYANLAPESLSRETVEATIDSLGNDNSLLVPPSGRVEVFSADAFTKKEDFLQKSDAVLDRREEWKAEAQKLREQQMLSATDRARQAVLMERLTLVSHYERFRKVIGEMNELEERIGILKEDQRKDAIRLKAVQEYPKVDDEAIKEKEKEVEKVQEKRDDLFKKAEDYPDEVEREELEVAETRLRLVKRELKALPTFEEKRGPYRMALLARMDARHDDIEKEEGAMKELGKTLEAIMKDLAILEFRAGDLEDPPGDSRNGSAKPDSFASRLKQGAANATRATVKGTVKAGKIGGAGVAIGGLSIFALATVPFHLASIQLKRLYNFSMNPMPTITKGFGRIEKFYKDGGAWNGTGDTIRWLLLGDPEPEKKDKK